VFYGEAADLLEKAYALKNSRNQYEDALSVAGLSIVGVKDNPPDEYSVHTSHGIFETYAVAWDCAKDMYKVGIYGLNHALKRRHFVREWNSLNPDLPINWGDAEFVSQFLTS
jgi:hypothetical protein